LVGHAALGPGHGGGVVGGCAGRVTPVEVRHQGRVALSGELPGDFLRLRVVPRHMVDDYHTAEHPGLEGPGEIGLDLVPAVPGNTDRLSAERLVHACA